MNETILWIFTYLIYHRTKYIGNDMAGVIAPDEAQATEKFYSRDWREYCAEIAEITKADFFLP